MKIIIALVILVTFVCAVAVVCYNIGQLVGALRIRLRELRRKMRPDTAA